MSDEISLAGKDYISSKRASVLTDYAQDYIGQLARSNQIEARRVGGLWYVSLESLNAYKTQAADFKPQLPEEKNNQPTEPESLVSFDGRAYISSTRASKLTGYNQDYVGQLARSGQILSRQVGNRWYVESESLLSHKKQKDQLLAAVQSQAVGLKKPEVAELVQKKRTDEKNSFNYSNDNGDLIPALNKKERREEDMEDELSEIHGIPIHVAQRAPLEQRSYDHSLVRIQSPKPQKRSRSFLPAATAGVLTIVIVLTFGFASLRNHSLYAFKDTIGRSLGREDASLLTASAAGAFNRIGDVLENLLVPELVYQRSD